jgi:methylenetetrahydrofolate dehydrogenase (NADP+) / methenyltetrahydrofolate cyclohydrolase
MAAQLLDGKALAAKIRQQLAREVAAHTERTFAPGLATVLVGEDPASEVYVASKRKLSVAVGMNDFHRRLPGNCSQGQVEDLLDELARDDRVSGILLQLPLPKHLDAEALIDRIPWHKDVDGLTTHSAGLLSRGLPGLRPCTPSGVITLLKEYDVDLVGANAVVIGRSELVGKPMARLLLAENATVTIAHSKSRDLAEITRRADVLVAAAGVPRLISRQHVSPGAAIVDVGIHREKDGLIGDVDFREVEDLAGLLTPVPGGVGPMTIAELLRNTLKAAQLAEARATRTLSLD